MSENEKNERKGEVIKEYYFSRLGVYKTNLGKFFKGYLFDDWCEFDELKVTIYSNKGKVTLCWESLSNGKTLRTYCYDEPSYSDKENLNKFIDFLEGIKSLDNVWRVVDETAENEPDRWKSTLEFKRKCEEEAKKKE